MKPEQSALITQHFYEVIYNVDSNVATFIAAENLQTNFAAAVLLSI